MQVEVERLSPSQVAVTVEVEPERVGRALDAAYRRLAQRYTVPGFRRGKAPRLVLERLLGKEALAAEALDPLVDETFEEALSQEGLEPLTPAEIDEAPQIEEGKPLRYVAKVTVRPEVQLPDVRSLTLNVPRPEVTDQDVEALLRHLAEDRAVLKEAQRVEANGVVVARVTTEAAGTELDGSSGDATIDLARPDVLPGAREALEGAEAGETRQVVWTLPADHPTHPGAEAITRFEVRRVMAREVPPVDDALARSLGAPSLEELRRVLRRQVEREVEERWRNARVEAALDALAEGAHLEVPEALVETALENSWQAFLARLRRAKLALPAYLAMAGTDENRLREELRPEAVREARNRLVLEALAIQEGLEPAEGEIRLTAEGLLPRRQQGKGGRNLTPAQRRYVVGVLRRDKARHLLEAIVAPPPLGEDPGTVAASAAGQ